MGHRDACNGKRNSASNGKTTRRRLEHRRPDGMANRYADRLGERIAGANDRIRLPIAVSDSPLGSRFNFTLPGWRCDWTVYDAALWRNPGATIQSVAVEAHLFGISVSKLVYPCPLLFSSELFERLAR